MKFSVLISEEDPDFQFLFKIAVNYIDPEIEINIVYTAEQVMDYLQKGDLQRELNRQSLPDVIIADLKTPFFEWNDVAEIRSLQQFKKTPLYVFVVDDTVFLRQKLLESGATDVFKRPDTFQDLRSILSGVLKKSKKPVVDKKLFCSRCEDFIEFGPHQFTRQIRLNDEEHAFIRSKFPNQLCIACINQLKTSYKISLEAVG
jgi:DNA-binding response OmpR family regulator